MMRELIADAEKRVKEGKGWLENEKIRLLWFDIRPMRIPVIPWLEEEWGAVLVLDMFSYCPYSTIDTSTVDSMFKGMAQRYLYESPMIRQARGFADNFADDIRRIVKDYSIDCVIWPGHMGHKDGAASIGIMRETCRDIGVPYLHIGLDLFDARYTTVEAVKDRISTFFTTMGLG
jgi:benzoyl-CoA reductase/2-hydroxyglutaryl-CoA dehydratase subunit BcrC/BadD/HgdB